MNNQVLRKIFVNDTSFNVKYIDLSKLIPFGPRKLWYYFEANVGKCISFIHENNFLLNTTSFSPAKMLLCFMISSLISSFGVNKVVTLWKWRIIFKHLKEIISIYRAWLTYQVTGSTKLIWGPLIYLPKLNGMGGGGEKKRRFYKYYRKDL